jgi:hypothetical protein
VSHDANLKSHAEAPEQHVPLSDGMDGWPSLDPAVIECWRCGAQFDEPCRRTRLTIFGKRRPDPCHHDGTDSCRPVSQGRLEGREAA